MEKIKNKNKERGQAGQALRQSFHLRSSYGGQAGQAMLIFVLVLGATMLSVTAIAGYVTLQKLRESSDVVDSAKAIYAADSGVEWCFYNKFYVATTSTYVCDSAQVQGAPYMPVPTFTNNLSGNTVDVSVSQGSSDAGTVVKSIGHSGRTYRAFGIFLDQFSQ